MGGWLLLTVYGGKIPAHHEISHEKSIQKHIVQGVVLGVQVANVRAFLLLANGDGHPGQHILVPSLI